MANPRWTETSVPRSLPERVAQLYYSHALFCATHPYIIISLAVSIILLCCYPLLSLPLPGNVPQQFADDGNASVAADTPRWLTSSSPYCYIQQVIMKTAVSPWSDDLMLTDAFRAPLAEVFNLLEVIQNYQHPNSSLTVADACVHVESVKAKKHKNVLPEYTCLVLSPANLWQQNAHRYHSDVNLISTIYSYQNLQKGKVSLTEILFGMNLKDSGIKRYPLRKRQRIIQFAVTIVLRTYDKEFLNGIQEHLAHLYPLHQSHGRATNTSGIPLTPTPSNSVLHIYYPTDFDYRELVPLAVTYLLLFSYVYFSVRKIELVRSKVGIALIAVINGLCSVAMFVGLCFFFGLEIAGNRRGQDIFPYLVIVVGLENLLVLTKSVVATASHLDVKIRIAQGLSREGWPITKTVLTEVTILTIGLITLVPLIQEYCIFAIVMVLVDFFQQMFFFTALLSLGIRQADTVTEPAQSFLHLRYNPKKNPGLSRSRSHPRLSNNVGPAKIPKRLMLVNFWANTRIVQRAFMLSVIVWIGAIVYNTGVLERFLPSNELDVSTMSPSTQDPLVNQYRSPLLGDSRRAAMLDMQEKLLASHRQSLKGVRDNSDLLNLRPNEYEPWRRLSAHHWSAILSLHNSTPLAGNYITILPAIHVASPVSPDRASALRNPFEKQMPQFQWHSLAMALDPLDLTEDLGMGKTLPSSKLPSESPFMPSSPMELFFTAFLIVVSVIVLAYTVLVLYRCICSRNYAEWRSSWMADKDAIDNSTQVILEAVPLVLESHPQEVECLASDGNIVVSSCLAGEVRCWDAATGELTTVIKRERTNYCNHHERSNSLCHEDNDHTYDTNSIGKSQRSAAQEDEEVLYRDILCDTHFVNDSVRSRYKSRNNAGYCNFPDLSSSIVTNFTSQSVQNHQDAPSRDLTNGFDYGPNIKKLYDEFTHERRISVEKEECECTCVGGVNCDRRKRTSLSDDSVENGGIEPGHCADKEVTWTVSPIWCLDCQDGLIVIGCANGQMEFWNSSTGNLKYVTDELGPTAGLTCVCLAGTYVVAARLNGALDIYMLSWHGNQTCHRRTHVRTGSAGSPVDYMSTSDSGDERLSCTRAFSSRAHQQPITVLEVEGGRILTGSQDHTLKVFGLVDQVMVYTLHGHCGPITALFIDRFCPTTAGSGSQDGMLCVWDLLTGACVYSLQAHDSCVTALTYSASYIISLGADDRLCVWERFQGHLLNTIQVSHTYCTSMVMLTHNLLVTSKQGSLIVWDVSTGEPVRLVKLGLSDNCVFVQHVVPLGHSVACDYGHQLRIVRFPLVRDKTE